MANPDKPTLSFDQFVKEARQKSAAESLAQKLLGSKGRRSSAPPNNGLSSRVTGSLASRVGVNKPRNSSIPRNNNSRPTPLNRLRSDISDRPSRPSSTRPEVGSRSNSGIVTTNGGGYGGGHGGAGLSIRGAAATAAPAVIVAQNFAPGTTAADIESVMFKVGGELTSCRLVASVPTVIAEMTFLDPVGAENVIEQFNGKKADGRTLYVYHRDDGGARRSIVPSLPSSSSAAAAPEPIPIPSEDDTMMVDEAAEAREANNRMREERRGRDDRERELLGDRERDAGRGRDGGRGSDRGDGFPAGPRGYRDDYYDRGAPRRSEGGYGGYGGGGRDGYAARGMSGGGRYDDRQRGYGRGGGGYGRR